MSKLKTLDISNNDIKQIPAEVYYLIHLKVLLLSHCNIQSIRNMNHLLQLTTMKLDHNDLEEDKLADFPPNLLQLNISYNHFQNFPMIISLSLQLVTLDLSFNRIESLSGIETLINIKELYLDGNRLTELPHNISKLLKLRKISLRNNNFQSYSLMDPSTQSIPQEFLTDTAVDHIDLNGNIAITTAMLLSFKGMNNYLEKRKLAIDKALSGGAMQSELQSLFGIE